MIKAFFTSNRAKSFYWRTGNMVFAELTAFVTFGFSNGEVTIPQWAVLLFGLFTAEVTKYLNSKAE